MTAIRASATALALAVATRTPTILWGDPGTGKTSAVLALAQAHGLPCEVVVASLRDPTDFGGLPVLQSDGTVRLAAPAWARRLAEGPSGGVLFLDEISTAPPATQAALLRVVLDRVVGDTPLGDKVAVVAAANPTETAAGGWDLSPPLANRFLHLDWSPLDPESWAESLVSGSWPVPDGTGPLPPNWEEAGAIVRGLVGGYVRARPQHLLAVPKAESDAGRAWPSPRSWAMLARLLTAARAVGASLDVQAALVMGSVGAGVGSEFLTYLRDADLPDPAYLLQHPQTFRLPTRGDLAYAILAGVADLAARRHDKPSMVAAWRIFGAAAREGAPDLGAAAAKTLAKATRADVAKLVEAEIRAYLPVLRAAKLVP